MPDTSPAPSPSSDHDTTITRPTFTVRIASQTAKAPPSRKVHPSVGSEMPTTVMYRSRRSSSAMTAYRLQEEANRYEFGRGSMPNRRQTRFLSYLTVLDLLRDVFIQGGMAATHGALTRAVIALVEPGNEAAGLVMPAASAPIASPSRCRRRREKPGRRLMRWSENYHFLSGFYSRRRYSAPEREPGARIAHIRQN